MSISKKIMLIAIVTFLGLYIREHPIKLSILPVYNPTIDTLKSASTKSVIRPAIKGKLRSFLIHIGKVEGNGSYSTVSSRGYLGLYQFHPKTLAYMGINVSVDEFLSNPILQDSVMIQYMRMNQRILKKVISYYSGTYYNGVYITKAGILASAHLVGPGGVLTFFRPDKYDYKTVDGNGVHIKTYMEKFAGYDLRGL